MIIITNFVIVHQNQVLKVIKMTFHQNKVLISKCNRNVILSKMKF